MSVHLVVQLVLWVQLTEGKPCTFNVNSGNQWVMKKGNVVIICWDPAIRPRNHPAKDHESFVEFCPTQARFILFISSNAMFESMVHSTDCYLSGRKKLYENTIIQFMC